MKAGLGEFRLLNVQTQFVWRRGSAALPGWGGGQAAVWAGGQGAGAGAGFFGVLILAAAFLRLM